MPPMLVQGAVCSNLRDHQSATQVPAAAGGQSVAGLCGGHYAYRWWLSLAEPGPGCGAADISLLGDGLDVKEPGTALIGREHECGQIERLIRDARDGEGGCLVLSGEPGIGKTALLEHAAQVPGAATTVLRAEGVEAESNLAFAGLYTLLRPILSQLDQLAGPQRQALAGALGLAPSPRPDRLFVSAAVLALLAAAAEDRPVLCLVDDAQWIDSPSAGALVFTARRLRAERVAIMFAAREGELRQFQDLPEMSLGSLPGPAAGQLLDRAAPGIAPTVRNRLLADANGNPLALLELPGELTTAQLGGRAALPEAIPLTPRLRRIFRDRVEALPAPTRLALLLAAADDTGDATAVLGAAERLQLPADALDPRGNRRPGSRGRRDAHIPASAGALGPVRRGSPPRASARPRRAGRSAAR
jgi:hypothetical protein